MFNPGIALLKFAASFAVVWVHFGKPLGTFGRILGLAVPAFMFMGIYLSAKVIRQGNGQKLGKRLERIVVPFVFGGCSIGALRMAIHGLICFRNVF